MNNYNKLINNLEVLKLNRIKENLDKYIDLINHKEKNYIDSLYELTNLEIEVMKEKKIMHSIQFAGFPYIKEFEDFDYITVDVTPTQEMVMLILIAIYNIGMSIFVIRNKFKNVEDFNF